MQDALIKSRYHPTAARNIAGVTLIEVLIAVVILSIGLLGIAGLQLATAKYKLGSNIRSATATLYSDFADRVRMNTDMAGPNWMTSMTDSAITSSDADSSKYTYQATWATQQGVSNSALSSTLCANSTGADITCTAADRATYDMLTWRKRVRDNLPQGAVYVTGNRKIGINVTFMWMDKDNTDKLKATDDGTTSTAVNRTQATTCSSADSTLGTETGLAQQTCCPAAASVPSGVRCTRFSFMP
jgi:type IV pilus assembly protein PilV